MHCYHSELSNRTAVRTMALALATDDISSALAALVATHIASKEHKTNW